MIDPLLKAHLWPSLRRRWHLRLGCMLAGCWTAAALVGLGLVALQTRLGWTASFLPAGLAAIAATAALIILVRHWRSPPDWRWIARQIERRHPQLDGRLLTAVQQEASIGTQLGYLQQRLLNEAIHHGFQEDWDNAIPRIRVALAHLAQILAFGLFATVLWDLRVPSSPSPLGGWVKAGITVTPGDTSLERGSSLVVLARFTGPLPANVDLVAGSTPETSRRVPLVKSLADPMFGGSVPEVTNSLVYHIEYSGQRTRDYQVSVFEHPRLERADAELTFPPYTGLPPKRIENTRRLSAVEGTRLDLDLRLNKRVASARLTAKDKNLPAISLQLETNQPVARLRQFPLKQSQAYQLQLVDADGRTNKVPAQFVLDVLTNRTPELRLTDPRGDQRPSALEEIAFAGTAWDDFGLQAFGIAYTLVGQETQFIELGRAVPGRERRPFQHLLRLENLSVKVDQLLSWFAWADDFGPDGQIRRTTGDLFFGEVRPFEEIFREGQGADGQSEQEENGELSGASGSQAARLAELQKQIISATWKLQREHGGSASATPASSYSKDSEVVRDSQAQALEQAQKAKERAQDPRATALWNAASQQMEKALARLQEAIRSPTPLPQALAAEQAAYQALLQLQTREHEVARARNRNQRGNTRGQQQQRQLDQLDLAQPDSRYETERRARTPQSPERQEQLQVLNRLQELARRQQDLNERLQELQTALQEARNDAEREDVRRRLKRLQEEEQQMLADVDELRQRLDRPENQSRLAEQRRQLEQTRQEIQRAAEAAREGAASQALAAGTRAQRQLQQLRNELRQQSSSEFADDLRQMRADARELSRRQEDVTRSMNTLTDPKRKTLSDTADRKALLDQLAEQKNRLTNLVDRATQVSQQTEDAEPLVSRELYDTLRKFSQDDLNTVKESQDELLARGLLTRGIYEHLQKTAEKDNARSLEVTAEMLRQGYLPQANQAEARARAGIGDLKRGVEQAAEKVLGDDTEALRLARQELERLTGQLEREIAQAEGEPAPDAQTQPQPPAATASPGMNEPPPGAQPQPQADNGRQRTGSGQEAPSTEPANRQTASTPGDRQNRTQPRSLGNGRGDRLPTDLDNLLRGDVQGDGRGGTGPITGDNFTSWSDRLREVEEMVELPDLRSDIAVARERARQARLEFKRELKKPDWAVVRLQVVRPLVEVRNQISEELARREPRDRLAPIDRDPVPHRYSELVRRYYEELGRAK